MLIANSIRNVVWAIVLSGLHLSVVCGQDRIGPESTSSLAGNDDFASLMVAGIDRFLLSEIARIKATRAERFTVDASSADAYQASLQPHRAKLAKCLGIRDSRFHFDATQIMASVGEDPVIAQSETFMVQVIRWPVLSDPSPQGQGLPSVFGEGLLLTPRNKILANVIVLPDADQTPEQVCGLTEGVGEGSQVARHLA